MNSIVVTSTKQNIKFGYEGEDNVTKIIFPYDESWLEYGEGNFEVRILRCGDEVAYTATEVVDDRQAMTLTMTVTDIELSVRGRGEMQLCYVCPDSIKKSPIYQYTVNRSVDYKYAVDPPEGSIIASVEKSLSEIKNTTNRLSNSVISIESSIDDVNSQIDNINDKISEFDEEIDSIGEVETRVDNLETSIQSINGRINTAEGNINENTESISDLNESVTELENRKVTDLETSGGRSDSGKYLTVGTDGKIKATSLTIPPTITVDNSLSTTSTNPVQNKVIKTELNNINSNIATCNTEISKINGSLGDVKAEIQRNTDLILSYVQDILTSVSGQDELAKSRIAANYFKTRASRYASLEFGCSWPSWDESHLSAGTRTKNAVDMVAYPSTDETAARNDFDNYFYGMIVNGHVRADGEFVVDYFDSDAEFNRYTRDTYVLFPPMYFKYDFTGGREEIDLCLSQKEGYAPVGPAIKSDGTVRDFIPIACYGVSLGDGGVPMTVSDALIMDKVSHNNQITTWKKKGTQYTMETVQEYEFLNILFMVTFATRDTQSIMAGCTSYDKQISPAVAETGVKRVIVTNANAAFFIVGSTVSVGTAKDRGSTANNIVDRRRITQIEDLGNGNSAIYIDALETFDVATSNFLSTMPWWSGATDTVLGTCGSPGSNSNGKYPYRLFGVECAWGQYVCLSNVIYKITSGIAKMYVAYDATLATSSGPNSDYEEVDCVIAGIGGKNGYISERGYDSDNPFVRFPTANGKEATSTTGYADNTYGMNSYTESTNGTREVLVGGNLGYAASAGRFYVNVYYALSTAPWAFAARLSALADCGRAAA